ncbi:MAG: ABC transporter permease subunit [Pseudomonadota bacterium]
MRALLRKELRESRWMLLALWLVLALAQFATLKQSTMEGSPMAAYRQLVSFMAPIMALLLVNRMVVREYMGRTQLFLETLPVSRTQVIAVKWLLGAALLLVPMAICLVVTLLAARSQVTLTPHYIALVTVRSMSFMLLFYALAFAVGLTGRYRYLIWGVLAFGSIIGASQWQLMPAQWAPFYLIQDSMVYERLHLPLRQVLITCGAALALIAATFALALSAQGSLVVALSRRMSPREKAGATIAVLGLLTMVSVFDVRKEKPVFVLKRASHSERAPVVAVGGASNPAAQDLANRLSADLADLQTYLALPQAPSLSVLPDAALDADVFQRGGLPDADGVVVRAAFSSEQFDLDGFRAYALGAWLHWHTRERAGKEDRRWLLDGLVQWMAARDLPQQQEKLALRAAYAARLLKERHVGIDGALHQWLAAREQLGNCLGNALAWRMVSALEQQVGAAKFQALARALAVRPPADARATLFEPGIAQMLAQAGAPDMATLARQFDKVIYADQTRLAQFALPAAAFKALPMEGSTFEVQYMVGKAGVDGAPFSVRYAELDPWDGELPIAALARVDATRSGVLPASYARGTRLFTAVERREELLGCTVRLAAQRWVVQ